MPRELLQHIREVVLSLTTGSGTLSSPIITTPETNTPAQAGYKYLRLISGPSGTPIVAIDMNTNSTATVSIFEFQVPDSQTFEFNRVNFILSDASMDPGDFGGIAGGLPSGSLFEIIDDDGTTTILDFNDNIPLQMNDDFATLAGAAPIIDLSADDMMPIKFDIKKPILMTAGQRIRWTNRDTLTAITKFRAMAQGRLEDV